nr:unnamed protein product [Spirometra erinaceieuropaei]
MVESGVPQGSVLGPILFLIYVDDAARDLDCEVAMFADDMKIWSLIRGPADEDRLQMNLNRLEEWSNRWLLRFNVAKCSILRLGNTARSASTRGYFLGGVALQEVEAQKDLGVLTTSSLKPSAHCSRVAKTAMSVLYAIKRAFMDFDKEAFSIRPLFEGGKNRNVRTEALPVLRSTAYAISTKLISSRGRCLSKFASTVSKMTEMTVREGSAEVKLPNGVFYNPVQEFNRDITIAVIRNYLKLHLCEFIDKGMKIAASKSASPEPTTYVGISILEALAASGLRSNNSKRLGSRSHKIDFRER